MAYSIYNIAEIRDSALSSSSPIGFDMGMCISEA